MLTHNTDKPDIYWEVPQFSVQWKIPRGWLVFFFSLLFVCGFFFFFQWCFTFNWLRISWSFLKYFSKKKKKWSPTPPLELHTDVLVFLGTFVNGCGMFNDALQVVCALCVIFHSCSVLTALTWEFLVTWLQLQKLYSEWCHWAPLHKS